MATVTEVTQEIIDEIQGTVREVRTFLTSAISDTTGTTVDVDDTSRIRVGDWLQVDSELMYVVRVNSDTELTVARGERSSTAATHTITSTCHINPRWWNHKVLAKLRDEYDELPRDVFAVTDQDVSFAARAGSAELTIPTDTSPIRIVRNSRDPKEGNTDVYRSRLRIVHNDSQFTTSGVGAQLVDGMAYRQAQTIQVSLAHTFPSTAWVGTEDMVTDLGLSQRLVNALRFGTMAVLQAPREFGRIQLSAQPGARRTEDVEQMSQIRLSIAMRQQANDRIDEERAELISKYGVTQDS